MTTGRLAALLGLVAALGVGYLLLLWPGGGFDGGGVEVAGGSGVAVGTSPEALTAPQVRDAEAAGARAVTIGRRARVTVMRDDDSAGELVLRFADEAALAAFRRSELPFGVVVLDENGKLRAVRIGWRGAAARDALGERYPEARIESNGSVFAPEVPQSSTEEGVASPAPFGLTGLSFIGVTGDNASWGKGVTVAVLDTGVEQHPVLSGARIQHVDLLAESAVREGVYAGHGTAVAAILAATDPVVRGVSPGVDLLDVRVLDGNGVGDSFTVAQGIVAAVDRGADVINMSLGSYGDSGVLRDAVAYAQAAGVVVVAAVGNDGVESVLYPAAYDGVIGVTAVDANSQRPAFANTGDAVDLAAPGTEVLAAWSDERYVRFNGTSAAAPFVAGTVAAGMSELAGGADDWGELLRWTSNDVGEAGGDPSFGEGVVDVGRLLTSDQAGVHDGAVASHLIDSAAAAEVGEGEIPLTIVVENRGTVTDTLHLQVEMANQVFSYEFKDLAPGDSASAGLAVDAAELNRTGGFDLVSRVRVAGEDADPSDNSKVSELLPTPEESPVE